MGLQKEMPISVSLIYLRIVPFIKYNSNITLYLINALQTVKSNICILFIIGYQKYLRVFITYALNTYRVFFLTVYLMSTHSLNGVFSGKPKSTSEYFCG